MPPVSSYSGREPEGYPDKIGVFARNKIRKKVMKKGRRKAGPDSEFGATLQRITMTLAPTFTRL
jgi:hypothetical protein